MFQNTKYKQAKVKHNYNTVVIIYTQCCDQTNCTKYKSFQSAEMLH